MPWKEHQKPIVTNIEVFSEYNNSKRLAWHTDARKRMIRAILYLKGGRPGYDGFEFMKGSHSPDHRVRHHLTAEEIKILHPISWVDLHGEPVDLVLFDPFGFHAKDVCNSEGPA